MEPARCRVVWKRVNHLLRGPRGRRMIRQVDVHDAPTVMRQHDKDEQDPTRQRRNREEVHRRRGGEMIRQERLPRLGWWTWVSFESRETVRSDTSMPCPC